MKKIYVLLILMICIATAGAQNIGIGTSAPQATLDVVGTIKITDQSQAAGKVLTSDNNGLATWSYPTGPCFIFATDQAIISNDYIGIGTASSVFIRNTMVAPFNGTLTAIIFSARGSAATNMTATVYKQGGTPGSFPLATSMSAIIVNGAVTGYAIATDAIPFVAGDLISVKITGTGSLTNGAAVTLLYK